jgi:hypothetical protein
VAGVSVHPPLDRLDVVGMAVRDARVPGRDQAGGDGREVTFEAAVEGVHAGLVVGPGRREPLGGAVLPEAG